MEGSSSARYSGMLKADQTVLSYMSSSSEGTATATQLRVTLSASNDSYSDGKANLTLKPSLVTSET